MKLFQNKLLQLLVILPMAAVGGPIAANAQSTGTRGGGDGYAIEFRTVAATVLEILEDAAGRSPPNFDLALLKRAIAETLVESVVVDSPQAAWEFIIDGATKDAVNYPDLKLIRFIRARWDEMPAHTKRILVLHEYLGILKCNDRLYQLSSLLADQEYAKAENSEAAIALFFESLPKMAAHVRLVYETAAGMRLGQLVAAHCLEFDGQESRARCTFRFAGPQGRGQLTLAAAFAVEIAPRGEHQGMALRFSLSELEMNTPSQSPAIVATFPPQDGQLIRALRLLYPEIPRADADAGEEPCMVDGAERFVCLGGVTVDRDHFDYEAVFRRQGDGTFILVSLHSSVYS